MNRRSDRSKICGQSGSSRATIHPMTTGTVRIWHAELGWGVIDSAETLGGCWAFYSHVWAGLVPAPRACHAQTIRFDSPRDLQVGETVEFEWEPVADQDGYKFRATDVRPNRKPPRWRAM